MHRRLWATFAACLLTIAPPAWAASISNEAALTLVPDDKGRFTALRVSETLTVTEAPAGPRTLVQQLGRRQVMHPIALSPEGLPLPSRFDAATGQLSLQLPANATQAIVRFDLPAQVAETGSGSFLDLGWLTAWDGGIDWQSTTVLFPQGFVPQHVRTSWDQLKGGRPVQQVALGVQALQFPAIRPPAEPLTVAFAPKLVSVVTAWWALIASLAVLGAFTLWRLSRLPSGRRRADRDPTPAEAAYLYADEETALLVAHLDLELRQALIRGGRDFQTASTAGIQDAALQLMLSYYQEPHPIEDYFRFGNPHFRAAANALITSLQDKGLLQDPEQARQCGWDLVGYWAMILTLAGTTVALEHAWEQAWFMPWFAGWCIVNALYLMLPLRLVGALEVTPHGQATLRKYQALLVAGMHARDAEHGYRLQLTYGMAFLGIDWLEQSLDPGHVAVYRAAIPDPVALPPLRQRAAKSNSGS